ncbi:alpha/beta fold hydrolase [Novosphingobium bradum]|uniref:Alpha/beta fold hydrolase n=1 Tax=Novosphingobium bradum TaxID=1737444 RepID=A0ABV7IMI4_9SPHN
MARFLLVHGAFHGGWCWYRLVAELERRGHRALAPDLPGHGRHAAPAAEASLARYADHVATLARAEPDPVILVGHSMGGAVITAAAELAPQAFAAIVYLTAFLAPDGGSMAGGLSALPAPGGLIAHDPKAEPLLYHDCPAEDVVLARLCLTAQPRQPLVDTIRHTPQRWGSVPRHYIGCTLDRVFPIAGQRAQAEAQPGTRWSELPSGHSPFFAMPDRLADALEQVAAGDQGGMTLP